MCAGYPWLASPASQRVIDDNVTGDPAAVQAAFAPSLAATCFLSSSTSVMMIKMKKAVLTHLSLKSSRINPFSRMLSLRRSPKSPLPRMPILCNRHRRDLSKELRSLERCPVLVTSFGCNMRYATNSSSNGQMN